MDRSERFQNLAQLRDAADILHAAETTAPRESFDLEARYAPPDTDIERQLAAIWGEVLAVAGVGIDDNFFELAGDSLQITQVMARIYERWGVELRIETFFVGPTIRQVAAAIATLAPAVAGEPHA